MTLDDLKPLVPVVTFVLGFGLNAFLESRKVRSQQLESSIIRAVALLNEWHGVLTKLILDLRSAETSMKMLEGLESYTSQRHISTKLHFELAILRKHAAAKDFVSQVSDLLGPTASDPRHRIHPYVATLRHVFQSVASTEFLASDLGDEMPAERRERLKTETVSRRREIESEAVKLFAAFEHGILRAIDSAAAVISKGGK